MLCMHNTSLPLWGKVMVVCMTVLFHCIANVKADFGLTNIFLGQAMVLLFSSRCVALFSN
jgi:hypothetical protein